MHFAVPRTVVRIFAVLALAIAGLALTPSVPSSAAVPALDDTQSPFWIATRQGDVGTHVQLDSLRPGDLLFWSPDTTNSRAIDHVGMYIGGGWGVNAGGTGTGVNIRSIPETSSWMMSLGVRPR